MRQSIKQAIRCGPVPKLRDWRKLTNAKLTRGERVLRFIEMLPVPEGALVGERIFLHDFQEAFIRSIYDNPAGTRRAIYSVGRKNGKSALIAGILLAHIIGPEAKQNSQIVSGAMSREQAALIFALACKMVQQSPALAPLVKIVPSSKRIIGLPMNVEYKALAADGKTAMGLSPVLVLIDELGQVTGPRSDFVDAITTASGAHKDALTVTLSTQAAGDSDLLSMWIDDATNSQDAKMVCHVYAAPEGCDLMDEGAWKLSNPAMGIFRSEDDMREQMERAHRMPASEPAARNLLLNQRVSTHSPFVSLNVWKAGAATPRPLSECARVVGGLDLSAARDLTALVLVGIDPDGRQHVHTYAWTPQTGLHDRAKTDRQPYDVWVQQGFLRTTPSATVDYDFVAAEMMEILADVTTLDAIGFDRWRIDLFKKALERQGGIELIDKLVPIGQGFKDQSICLDALEATLLNERASHGMHPVLTMCAANAVIERDPAGSRKLSKHKAIGRIDAMAALANAAGVAGMHTPEPEKKYSALIF